jgi:hypothetical protein
VEAITIPPSDFSELHEEFLAMESELDLLNEIIGDVHFWERLRFSVHKDIATGTGLMDATPSDGDGVSEHLAGSWLLARNALVRNPFLTPDSDLLFYGKGRRKQLQDGRWWDIYIDPLIDSIDRSATCLERPYNVSHSRPAKTDCLRYTDLIQYAGTLLETVGVGRVSLSESERASLGEIESEIAARFDVDVSLVERVRRDLSHRRVRLPLYRTMLHRVSPKAAFLTASYGGRETFVEACQAEGIPIVELQHGVITRYHMAYSFPDVSKHVFPDYFFTFGDYWTDSVELPLPDEHVIPVGYPYLERRSSRYADRIPDNRILVISQRRAREQLSRFALLLDESDAVDSDVIYKLHPDESGEWREAYPRLADSNVEVVGDEPPLYELFATSTTQVGVNSTALFEGLKFGLDTFVLDAPGWEYMTYLVDSGFAAVVSSVEEFVDTYQAGDVDFESVDETYFFEPDALSNFEDAVTQIIATDDR